MLAHRYDPGQSSGKFFTNYADCAKHGGNVLKSEFSACLGSNNQLYLQYSAQDIPHIQARQHTNNINIVEHTGDFSDDLVAFLKQDETGCKVGYYKILKEDTGRFAEMNYGCEEYSAAQNATSFIIAMRLSDGWSMLSPTNNMNGLGVPTCLLVDVFMISKSLTPTCYDTSANNLLHPVSNP